MGSQRRGESGVAGQDVRRVTRLAQLATRFGRPVLLIVGDYHNYREDIGVDWFKLYGVQPVANITQIVVNRSIEAATDKTPIDYSASPSTRGHRPYSAGPRSTCPEAVGSRYQSSPSDGPTRIGMPD